MAGLTCQTLRVDLGIFSRGLRPWGDDFWERKLDGTWEKTSWEVDEGMTYCMLFA